MNFTKLRAALSRTYSQEACVEILAETAIHYREQTPFRWYLLLLNRIYVQIVGNPELLETDLVDPLWVSLSEQSLAGIEAIERDDHVALVSAANFLTETYCAVP